MKEDKTINDGKVLYISGYGEDSNETVVYALNMPVSVTVHLENNGSGIVEFREKTEKDNWKLVCQTGFIPDATQPVDIHLHAGWCILYRLQETYFSFVF